MKVFGVGFDMEKKYAFNYHPGVTGCPVNDLFALSLDKSQTYSFNVLYGNTDSVVKTVTIRFGPEEHSCRIVDLK